MGALTSFPLAVVLVLGPLVFELLLGQRWYEAGVLAQILVPWMGLRVYYSTLTAVYPVTDRQGEYFLWNVLLLAVQFAALYVGGHFLNVRGTLALFVAVSAIMGVWPISRPLSLVGVSRRWAVMAIGRAYLEPLILLTPAGLLYWCLEAQIATLAALTAACAVYCLLLHFRHPEVVRRLLSRSAGPRAGRLNGERRS
jgi:O-antigen/teichoic acid export membrane protein